MLSLLASRMRVRGKKLLLLVTTQRSGSTLLYDSLRYMPFFSMLEGWDFFRLMGIEKGRCRYPIDLLVDSGDRINNSGRSLRFVRPVPGWDGTQWHPSERTQKVHHLEKIHPHFVDYNSASFLHTLQRLRTFVDVKVIYLIRDPVNSVYSHTSYQRRNPEWYSDLSSIEDLLTHYWRAMEFMVDSLDGDSMVLDYRDLRMNYGGSLAEICAFCGVDVGALGKEQWEGILLASSEFTGRESIVSSNTMFLSKGDADRRTEDDLREMGLSADAFSDCLELYRVLSLKRTSREIP